MLPSPSSELVYHQTTRLVRTPLVFVARDSSGLGTMPLGILLRIYLKLTKGL
jgi:hypothetical protein